MDIPAYTSIVHSAELDWTPGKEYKVEAEYAESLFSDPNLFWNTLGTGYQVGSAARAEAQADFGWLNLGGFYRDADDKFVSAPAWQRTQNPDTSPLGPFYTDNVFFDPATGLFTSWGIPTAPATILNGAEHTILPPEIWQGTGGNVVFAKLGMLPYDPMTNASWPYGAATPNRSGYEVHGGLNLLGGFFKPFAAYGGASEVQGEWNQATGVTLTAEQFTTEKAGAVIDLAPVLNWPLQFSGGMRLENTSNGQWVAFSSALLDAGVLFSWSKDTQLSFGYRHLDANGTLPYADPTPFGIPDATLQAAGRRTMEEIYDTWALGFSHWFGPTVEMELMYGSLYFDNPYAAQATDALDQAGNFEADEGYARIKFLF